MIIKSKYLQIGDQFIDGDGTVEITNIETYRMTTGEFKKAFPDAVIDESRMVNVINRRDRRGTGYGE